MQALLRTDRKPKWLDHFTYFKEIRRLQSRFALADPFGKECENHIDIYILKMKPSSRSYT